MLIPIFRYLDTVGDGTGTKSAIGDYSASSQAFKIVCPQDKGIVLSSFMIHLAGTTAFTLTGYGSIAALTNGISMSLLKNGNVYDLLDGSPIKTNDDLAHFSPKVNHLTFSGGDSLIVPLTFDDFGFKLELNSGDYLQVTLNDNFSSLTSQYFIVKGYGN